MRVSDLLLGNNRYAQEVRVRVETLPIRQRTARYEAGKNPPYYPDSVCQYPIRDRRGAAVGVQDGSRTRLIQRAGRQGAPGADLDDREGEIARRIVDYGDLKSLIVSRIGECPRRRGRRKQRELGSPLFDEVCHRG